MNFFENTVGLEFSRLGASKLDFFSIEKGDSIWLFGLKYKKFSDEALVKFINFSGKQQDKTFFVFLVSTYAKEIDFKNTKERFTPGFWTTRAVRWYINRPDVVVNDVLKFVSRANRLDLVSLVLNHPNANWNYAVNYDNPEIIKYLTTHEKVSFTEEHVWSAIEKDVARLSKNPLEERSSLVIVLKLGINRKMYEKAFLESLVEHTIRHYKKYI